MNKLFEESYHRIRKDNTSKGYIAFKKFSNLYIVAWITRRETRLRLSHWIMQSDSAQQAAPIRLNRRRLIRYTVMYVHGPSRLYVVHSFLSNKICPTSCVPLLAAGFLLYYLQTSGTPRDVCKEVWLLSFLSCGFQTFFFLIFRTRTFALCVFLSLLNQKTTIKHGQSIIYSPAPREFVYIESTGNSLLFFPPESGRMLNEHVAYTVATSNNWTGKTNWDV